MWHERVWTMQEFILAREVNIYVGKYRLSLNDDVADHIFSLGRLPKHASSTRKRLASFSTHVSHRLLEIKYTIDNGMRGPVGLGSDDPSSRFLQIIEAIAVTQATEPSDKIFGVLNILPLAEAEMIDVDYRLPCQEVYAKATYAGIRCLRDFRILLARLVGDVNHESDTLASWVLDFESLMPDSEQSEHLYLVYESWVFEWQAAASYPAIDTSLLSQQQQLILQGTFSEPLVAWLSFDVSSIRVGPKLGGELEVLVRRAAERSKACIRNQILRPVDADVDGRHASRTSSPYHETISAPAMSSPKNDSLLTSSAGCVLLSALHTFWNEPEGAPAHDKTGRNQGHEGYIDKTFEHLMDIWSECVGIPLAQDSIGSSIMGGRFLDYTDRVAKGLTLFSTSNGLVGFAPGSITGGDIIAYVPNPFPFMVLRPKGDTHEFRGFAYIHHAISPKFWESFDMATVPKSTFTIH